MGWSSEDQSLFSSLACNIMFTQKHYVFKSGCCPKLSDSKFIRNKIIVITMFSGENILWKIWQPLVNINYNIWITCNILYIQTSHTHTCAHMFLRPLCEQNPINGTGFSIEIHTHEREGEGAYFNIFTVQQILRSWKLGNQHHLDESINSHLFSVPHHRLCTFEFGVQIKKKCFRFHKKIWIHVNNIHVDRNFKAGCVFSDSYMSHWAQ